MPDRYPLPNLQNSTSRLSGKWIFLTLDLIRAFHNIPICDSDICKTAIVSPVGFYEYHRMSSRLKNASSTDQRYMDFIFADMPFVFCYLDLVLRRGTS